MRKVATILTLAFALASSVVLVTAVTAEAHEHQICTPGTGDPVLPEEPFHGDDPTGGAILNNPNVTATNYNTWGLHPLHNFLHRGPSEQERIITVIPTTKTCPAG